MTVGEWVEEGRKLGKFEKSGAIQMSDIEKKGETHTIGATPAWPCYTLPPHNPIYQYPPQYNTFPILPPLIHNPPRLDDLYKHHNLSSKHKPQIPPPIGF